MGLKVVFATPDEPTVIPPVFEKVIPALGHQVAGMVVVSPIFKNFTWRSQAMRFIRAFGVWEFLVEAAGFARDKTLNVVKRTTGLGRYHSIELLARHHGIRVFRPEDVNDPRFLDELRTMAPDLVISVSCPQIFKQPLLELPTRGCVNLHSGLLPDYRGMLPTFWVLANGESETGVTAHVMAPGIDDGNIILQRRVAIADDDTLHSLMSKTKALAVDIVLETVQQFEDGDVVGQPNDARAGRYFSFPKREDVVRFKARGRRLR
jgi:methionyl-tRNA formyltransferase